MMNKMMASPKANYTIEGLSAENHGPYCRDAVRALLQAVPKISGVTFRVHGESGVQEGSYQFWKTVFEGVATCGRKVEIDMHAKGMDQGMIDAALASGQPVKISPKYWAEHLGMPYHQADIREQERPRQQAREATGLMKLSAGSRSFLRYGYGDLLREDRKWGVLHRIWPGTQRLLIWGDPLTAAAYSRAFSFCGSDGVEIMEPLSFKGRRGSGIAGGRCGYAEKSGNTFKGQILGTDGGHKNTKEMLCPEYVLRSDNVTYRIRPRDEKHPVLLPVGETAEFRIQKDRLFLKITEMDDKERDYTVVSMTPVENLTAERK
jgi:hypothetical protein